jgi:repressor LexA
MSSLTELEKRMLLFVGEYLRENDGRGPTLGEIGQGCGVKSVGTVHRYLSSIERKGFLTKSGSGWRTRTGPNELPFRGKVAAGKPIEAVDRADSLDLATLLFQPDCFVLRVEGDSMIERGILDGDLVIIRPASTAVDGEIVLALIDNEATLKEFQRVDGGRQIKLRPHNQKMEARIYSAEDVQIQGILTSVIRTDP